MLMRARQGIRLEPELRRHRLMWRGGCIIRSRFLGKIKEAFDKNPKLTNLLLDDFFTKETQKDAQSSLAHVVAAAVTAHKQASLCRHFSTALAFYDATAPPPAGQPAPGPARLLRRPHLRAHSTSRAANSSTPTGPAAAAKRQTFLQFNLTVKYVDGLRRREPKGGKNILHLDLERWLHARPDGCYFAHVANVVLL
jgi:hypothetical protein